MKAIKRRRLLLATDLSARCDRAFDRAMWLARQWDAELTVVSVLSAEHAGPEYDPGPRWKWADRAVARAKSRISLDLRRAGIDADVIVRRGVPSELILDVARDQASDLIITGIARNHGLARVILGATLESLTRQSPAPVLVVKQPAREAYQSAIVGTDFSRASEAALRAAHHLFRNAAITVLHTYRPPLEGLRGMRITGGSAYHDAFEACAAFTAKTLPGHGQEIRCMAESGFPETQLNRHALDRSVDLIVAGAKRRSLVTNLLFGRVTDSLILTSPCDLLLVPTDWRAKSSAVGARDLPEAGFVNAAGCYPAA